MDQVKIGKFIAERRKQVGLTQMQLAEKLNITDRAVSKWENGRSMPDSSIMLELCGMLGITVNDLLNGEVITMEDYNKKSEQILLEMARQKEEMDKKYLALEIVIGVASVIGFLSCICIAALAPIEEWLRYVMIAVAFVPFLICMFAAIRIEQTAGYYECAVCHHKHVPTYNSVLWAMHFGRTRYMKCPKCHKRSWQRKVISKD